MSTIYIQEPPTKGKVLLHTTVGDIDVELWSKECPLACRNFVQLCLENYYDGAIFHRIVPDFIVQGGDPTGTGEGGSSIYDKPFKDEFHSRLRFTRRGLVAMAKVNGENGSQFFFTLGPTPELTNNHTLFGKVTGNTLFNMLRLAAGEIIDEKPVYPQRITSTEILSNPFHDIIPRLIQHKPSTSDTSEKPKSTARAIKSYKLLSFGEEAEEDEMDFNSFKGAMKSAHDCGNDPSLCPETFCLEEDAAQLSAVKEQTSNLPETAEETLPVLSTDAHEDLKKEIKKITKELKRTSKQKHSVSSNHKDAPTVSSEQTDLQCDSFVKKFKDEVNTYSGIKRKKEDKKIKEELTLQLLERFRNKLENANSDELLSHALKSEDIIQLPVVDANVDDPNRYDLNDPRNPMNKRRRQAFKKSANPKED